MLKILNLEPKKGARRESSVEGVLSSGRVLLLFGGFRRAL